MSVWLTRRLQDWDMLVERVLDALPADLVPVPARGWSGRRIRWSRGGCSACDTGWPWPGLRAERWRGWVRLYRNGWGGCAICWDCWLRARRLGRVEEIRS